MTEPLVDQPRVLCPHGRRSRLTCQDCVALRAYHGLDPRQCDNGEIPPTEPFGQLLQTLRQRVGGQCLPLPAARQVAEQAVTAAGFDALHDAKITLVDDPAATCTRADMPVSGLIEITLRGPSR